MEIFLELIQIIIMSGLGRYRREDKVEDNYCVCVCVCVITNDRNAKHPYSRPTHPDRKSSLSYCQNAGTCIICIISRGRKKGSRGWCRALEMGIVAEPGGYHCNARGVVKNDLNTITKWCYFRHLIEFMILVVYTGRSLIDGGSSHETTPWPGPGFSAERM